MAPLPKDYTITGQYAKVDSSILDVGCGVGAYIDDLAGAGFQNVRGIDPFLDQDIVTSNGVSIRKLFLEQVEGSFDIILSHHSFEHVPRPLQTLVQMRELLRPGGCCLITVPVVEDLYREFGPDSYIIQAPQHCSLQSIEGMKILANRAGLSVSRVVRDATTTANWYKYSKLWKLDIVPDEKNRSLDSYLEPDDLAEIRQLEDKLNTANKGDNVTFVLRVDN
jgi:2-polyprenyl-3-methyl-5-hydroxy-6-metoxy-1,4-benzoquinol methylase